MLYQLSYMSDISIATQQTWSG
ncbi:conserved protein of unknown function [Pseudomonas marincola]|uniref:Uncharacterized protein n=1 Tax=Pseudomonas marincola TaxID=437900 RepID=A0A653E3M8_9PSED|nr:conserved protein of unknown function [Pseudomonas marincola]